MPTPPFYLVTDVETDGPDPDRHSLLSIGTVAVSDAGRAAGEFTINLLPREGAVTDPGTMRWWRRDPAAHAAATRGAVEAGAAIRAWAAWVEALPGRPVFVGAPVTFDGAWVDSLLRRHLGRRLFDLPRQPGLCEAGGLDLPSLIMGRTGRPFARCGRRHYPHAWLGPHRHDHTALADARGYAHLLRSILDGSLGPEAPRTRR